MAARGNGRRWFAVCVAAGCLAASTVGAAVGSGAAAEGRAAVVPGDDWVVDDPAAHGMDAGVPCSVILKSWAMPDILSAPAPSSCRMKNQAAS